MNSSQTVAPARRWAQGTEKPVETWQHREGGPTQPGVGQHTHSAGTETPARRAAWGAKDTQDPRPKGRARELSEPTPHRAEGRPGEPRPEHTSPTVQTLLSGGRAKPAQLCDAESTVREPRKDPHKRLPSKLRLTVEGASGEQKHQQ